MSIFVIFDYRYDNVWWRGERFEEKNVVLNLFRKIAFDVVFCIRFDSLKTKRKQAWSPLMWMYLFSHPESASGSRVVDLKEGLSNLGFWSFSIRFGEENFDVKSVKPGCIYLVYLFRMRGLWIRIISRWIEREWRTLKYLFRNLLL